MVKNVDLKIREKISQTMAETAKKRKTQTLKVFELKVNVHHFSKENLKKMVFMFVQGKWAYNDCLASEKAFEYKYTIAIWASSRKRFREK